MTDWPACSRCTERPAVMTLALAAGPGRRTAKGRYLVNVCGICAVKTETEGEG